MKPRLAVRADWNSLHKLMSKRGEYVAEHKLDGERLTLHFRRGVGGAPDRTEWFTRNCKNFSGNYGDAMAPVLRRCLRPELHECILDGEMMVWNLETEEYSPFGENRGLGDHKKRLERSQQPCYVVFDCLWLNGEAIDKLPLRERRALVERHVDWEPHSMQLSQQTIVRPNPPESTTHTMEIMLCLDRAMALGYEGVMFKSSNSAYVPGARDNDWMKLKPDYVHDMGDELDLLIIAGYYGEGQRRGGAISHFLLGVQAPPTKSTSTARPSTLASTRFARWVRATRSTGCSSCARSCGLGSTSGTSTSGRRTCAGGCRTRRTTSPTSGLSQQSRR